MELTTQSFVRTNKTLFEEINDSYDHAHGMGQGGLYSILHYNKMLTSIIDYIDGYLEYKESGSNEYNGKVDSSTVAFYDKMFVDPKYRHDITLSEFRAANVDYLKLTKQLQDKMQELEKCLDTEATRLLHITDRQYRKIGKVYQDDMNLYLWLVTDTQIPTSLKNWYTDQNSPVMHKR